MKTRISIITFAIICHLGIAQKGQINIEQDQKINELIGLYKSPKEDSEYYRIQVGFGSSKKAQEIKSNVEIDFPQLASKTVFESPTYRVRVGRFKTKLEAERNFMEVRAEYPDAMLLKPKKSTK